MPNSRKLVVCVLALLIASATETDAFSPLCSFTNKLAREAKLSTSELLASEKKWCESGELLEKGGRLFTNIAAAVLFTASAFAGPVYAENELSDKYGGGFDSSLVDQTCLVDKCSLQAKACLADDPSCRKGLTCTAKCLGDNACITGCMARYGNGNLDNLLKCTIEDHECIKVAILDGGADKFGEEPRSPGPTVRNFDLKTLDGTWFKVVGYNPNYDCYACQRNSFHIPNTNMLTTNDKLQMDVEFSMPHLLPDGSPPPPKNIRETIQMDTDTGKLFGSQSVGLNDYSTHETMVFDNVQSPMTRLVMNSGTPKEASYSRTAHSEGEMFGLKFWENWYVLGENDAGADEEFKFIFYNGKTRQNTYEGAFVYSRTKQLSSESLKKVYKIASEAGMNPEQFCRIRNGCFKEQNLEENEKSSNPFRGILASTKVSQLLGVESVAAQDNVKNSARTADVLTPVKPVDRVWWQEVGDYLENPHKHFEVMNDLRLPVEWPDDVKSQDDVIPQQ